MLFSKPDESILVCRHEYITPHSPLKSQHFSDELLSKMSYLRTQSKHTEQYLKVTTTAPSRCSLCMISAVADNQGPVSTRYLNRTRFLCTTRTLLEVKKGYSQVPDDNIIWGMSGVCLGQHLRHTVSIEKHSAVLHASLMRFFIQIWSELVYRVPPF